MMQTSNVSPLEELMIGTGKPVSMLLHCFHSFYHPTVPADHLLAVLARSSMLALRLVSHTTKTWVEESDPELLTKLRVPCPLPRFALQSNSTLRCLCPECQHLSINLSPSSMPIPVGTLLDPSPAGQIFNIVNRFSSLRIDVPVTHAFEPALSLRLALESTPLHTLVTIHIEPVDLESLLALLWGGFNAVDESTWISQPFWRSLKSLRIGLTTDWLEYAHKDLRNEQDLELKEIKKEERQLYRQGIQTLHDYFVQLSLQDTLETLRFDWIGGKGKGPNPLLLDEEVAKEEGGKWFSAPGIVWRSLRELWLGGVALSGMDFKILKARLQGMEKLMVWETLAASGIIGTMKKIDGVTWLGVDLEAEILEEFEEEDVETLIDTDEETGSDRGGSMVVPFMLEI